MRDDADYYTGLPIFEGFANIVDPAMYRPLPDDWLVALTDVVDSAQAIEAGRYKAVNTAGASVKAAVTNALQGRKFPYALGGDGASFVVSSADAALARQALSATAAWARDDLDLELRTARVPVAELRKQSLDVSVARFAPSKNVAYAMFSSGGLAWAECAMKGGRFRSVRSCALPAAGGREFRFSQVRRQSAHDARLFGCRRRRPRKVATSGRVRWYCALRSAPAADGDHDLHRAIDFRWRSRAFHRPGGRRLRAGRATPATACADYCAVEPVRVLFDAHR